MAQAVTNPIGGRSDWLKSVYPEVDWYEYRIYSRIYGLKESEDGHNEYYEVDLFNPNWAPKRIYNPPKELRAMMKLPINVTRTALNTRVHTE